MSKISSIYDVIIGPVNTGKAFEGRENENGIVKYSFYVNNSANKPTIKKAVKALFNQEVLSINIIKLPGKVKKFRNIMGKTKAKKKALVTLAKGGKIEL